MKASASLRALTALTLLAACTPQNVVAPRPTSATSASPAARPASPAPGANPASPTAGLPSGISEDSSLRESLLQILRQKLPGLNELAAVSTLTREHAAQLAENPAATEFRVQASYDPIPPGALQTRLLQLGIYSTDNLVNAYLSDGTPENVKARFAEQIDDLIGPVDFSHYGVSVLRKGPSWYVSTVMLTEVLHLDDLPLRLPAPGTRRVSGELRLPGFSRPSLLLTRPDGSVASVDMAITGNRFSADVPFDQAGLYSFEVNVVGPLGPLPATNFVLAVGVPYPATRPISETGETVSDVARARATLLELVNRDRAAMGTDPLSLDDSLSQAAQSHSDDMVENNFIGHNSPTHGTPQMQAARFKINNQVTQNLAISRSLAASQHELMSSPGHRRTIIDPNHTHVGFGVRNGPDGFLYITQLFSQRRLALDEIPASVRPGQSFNLSGVSTQSGFVAAFVGDAVVAQPLKVTEGQRFTLPVKIDAPGKQRLQIGFSEAPRNNVYNFTFNNFWDLEVTP